MIDYQKLLYALANEGVEYIIVGGAAATAHGSSRLTDDLDVVYRRSAENITRLSKSLNPFSPYLRGAPPGLPFKFDVETIKRGLNFTLATTVGNIDTLGEIPGGGTYEDLLNHTIKLELFGVSVLCIDLEHLIHVKRAAGRPKDLEAISELEAILEAD